MGKMKRWLVGKRVVLNGHFLTPSGWFADGTTVDVVCDSVGDEVMATFPDGWTRRLPVGFIKDPIP